MRIPPLSKPFRSVLLFIILITLTDLHAQVAYQVFENRDDLRVKSGVQMLGDQDGRLVFLNEAAEDFYRIYVSDGTEEGTIKISPEDQVQVFHITTIGDDMYFLEKRENDVNNISKLTKASTEFEVLYTQTLDIRLAEYWNGSIYLAEEANGVFDDRLVRMNLNNNAITEIMNSDFGGFPGLGAAEDFLYFIVNTQEGKMIAKTDGTVEGTEAFYKLFPPGNEFSYGTVYMEGNGNEMFFFYHPGGDTPYNLWHTDGTAEGTAAMKEYQRNSFGLPTKPFSFFNDKFFFVMRDEGSPSGTTYHLNVSDGTPEGTYNLNDQGGYWHPRDLTVFNNSLYFSSLQNNWGMMKTDGTIAGTEMIIHPYGNSLDGGIGRAIDIERYNDKLVFQAYSEDHGTEIFVSDGTEDGFELLVDVVAGDEDSSPHDFMQVGNRLFFVAGDYNRNTLFVFDPELVGVNELNRSVFNSFEVYPNPITQNQDINVNFELVNNANQISISLFDLKGKLLSQETLAVSGRNISHQINTNSLNSGNYALLVRVDGEVHYAQKISYLSK